MAMPPELSSAPPALNVEAANLYESGKHRRYSLLFSINGGAFAVAKLMTVDCGKPCKVLGALNLRELAAGMILITAVMVWDIYAFGKKMSYHVPGAFGPVGKWVLLLLGLLVMAGWFLAGFA
jgi:hypothetical protein